MSKGFVKTVRGVPGGHYDVPAYICEQCKEPLFTEEAIRLVQQMIRSLDARRQELSAISITVCWSFSPLPTSSRALLASWSTTPNARLCWPAEPAWWRSTCCGQGRGLLSSAQHRRVIIASLSCEAGSDPTPASMPSAFVIPSRSFLFPCAAAKKSRCSISTRCCIPSTIRPSTPYASTTANRPSHPLRSRTQPGLPNAWKQRALRPAMPGNGRSFSRQETAGHAQRIQFLSSEVRFRTVVAPRRSCETARELALSLSK